MNVLQRDYMHNKLLGGIGNLRRSHFFVVLGAYFFN